MATINGEWIKDVRERLGLNQAEFAARLGVTAGAVGHWENNIRKPTGPARILLEMLALEAERVSGEKIPA